MGKVWPETAGELAAAATLLERDLGDIADIEFTVEEGVLWLLQCAPASRAPAPLSVPPSTWPRTPISP